MNKQICNPQATVFCGIDVSASSLAVVLIEPDGSVAQREFPNRACGHRALLAWLAKRGGRVRVSLEATVVYSLDLALALDAAATVELAVLNPKLVNRFAQTLRRSKTDAPTHWFWQSTASGCRSAGGSVLRPAIFVCAPLAGISSRWWWSRLG
jgi:hypothetical protein